MAQDRKIGLSLKDFECGREPEFTTYFGRALHSMLLNVRLA